MSKTPVRPESTFLAWIMILSTATAACARGSGDAPQQAADESARACEPLETRLANAESQQPAFEGQTRACGVTSGVAFEVTVIAAGLDHPWAVEPLPDGDFLVTELPGTMRIVAADGTIGPPISGVPEVAERNQGGLLDVALGPDFASNRMIYWSYSEPRGEGENATSVARGFLSADGRRLDDVEVILRTRPAYDGGHHFGSRLLFTSDGHLFVTLGERAQRPIRDQAQDLDSHLGKILRIRPDGSVPDDNPFVERDDAYPETWSLGHRNIQAATLDPDGRLWTVEHGPRGGDELNLISPGVNYGWPRMSYGEQYSGQPIPDSRTQREGMRQPVYYWDPVIAPSGAQWYTGEAFPEWRNSLFVGALRQQRLVRLEVELLDMADSDLAPEAARARVTGEEHLLADRGQRVRDVRQGPDGALYVVTDETAGELWRIAPVE
jgi:glucose/arabinose dehydrogenase